MTWRYAICNETFGDWDFARVCDFVAQVGYDGIEIAPFTLAPRITDLTEKQLATMRRRIESAGITNVGLHWLLAKTEGLSITSADANVRMQTSHYLKELVRACRMLGGGILVFGSPLQRRIPHGYCREDAAAFAVETLRGVAPALEECDVQLLLEPLSLEETDFLNSCAEALALSREIGHPRIGLHLDVKAMASETFPIVDLIRQYGPTAGHFHANDSNRRGPGFGKVDFQPILAALSSIQYSQWISVEVFDYSPDPETIARDSLRYLRQCEPSTN